MRVLPTRWRRKQLTLKLRNCHPMYNRNLQNLYPSSTPSALYNYIICEELIITRRCWQHGSRLSRTELDLRTGTYVCTYGRPGGRRSYDVTSPRRVVGPAINSSLAGRPSNAASVTSCYCVVASCCSNCGRVGNNITSIAGSFSLPRTN